MPFILAIVGIVIFVSAIRGTSSKLFKLIVGDFTGQGSFLYWLVAILAIGAVGYVPSLKKISDAFLLLLVLVLFIHNKGFFSNLTTALKNIAGSTPAQSSTVNSLPLTSGLLGTLNSQSLGLFNNTGNPNNPLSLSTGSAYQ